MPRVFGDTDGKRSPMGLKYDTELGSNEVFAPARVRERGEASPATETKLKRDVAINALPESIAMNPQVLGWL